MTVDNLTAEQVRIRNIIVPVCVKHGVDKLSLFGSRARDDYDQDSDYDFIYEKGQVTSLLKHAAFGNDLKEALKGEVDLVTEDASKVGKRVKLKSIIKNDEVVLFERQR